MIAFLELRATRILVKLMTPAIVVAILYFGVSAAVDRSGPPDGEVWTVSCLQDGEVVRPSGPLFSLSFSCPSGDVVCRRADPDGGRLGPLETNTAACKRDLLENQSG